MKEYKPIKRYNDYTYKKETFIARGQWGDGHLVYLMLDENGNDIEFPQFAQIRHKGQLVMTAI